MGEYMLGARTCLWAKKRSVEGDGAWRRKGKGNREWEIKNRRWVGELFVLPPRRWDCGRTLPHRYPLCCNPSKKFIGIKDERNYCFPSLLCYNILRPLSYGTTYKSPCAFYSSIYIFFFALYIFSWRVVRYNTMEYQLLSNHVQGRRKTDPLIHTAPGALLRWLFCAWYFQVRALYFVSIHLVKAQRERNFSVGAWPHECWMLNVECCIWGQSVSVSVSLAAWTLSGQTERAFTCMIDFRDR